MKQRGFTLVELAIVLMIIGLLIGGILKGQELIQNARIVSSEKQFKSYQAATTTFQDAYGALPGDITNPGTRVPNCTATPCITAGDGNGILASAGMQNQENTNFWRHLSLANMISGVDAAEATPTISVPMGGRAFIIYLTKGGWGAGTTEQETGHYLHSSDLSIPCGVVARYDTKFDDGKPNTGDTILHVTNARGTGNTYDVNLAGNCAMLTRVYF